MKRLRGFHRWTGLLVGGFVLFQGITGAVSQQRFVLLAASEPDVYAVSKITDSALSPAELIAAVKASKPDFRPAHVMLPMDNSPATAAIVMGGRKLKGIDMSRSITVDQYSGRVIAERPSSDGWVGKVTGWHKWTSYGVGGRIFVTVFGILTMGFMVSGMVLWGKTRSYAGRRTGFWRIHRGAGLAVGIVLSVVSLTGVWLNLATWKERNEGQSVVAANMRAGMRQGHRESVEVGLSDAWKIASQKFSNQRLAAFSDVGPHAAQYWFAFTDSQLRRTDILVNPASGEVATYPSGLIDEGTGVRSWLYSIHTGFVLGATGGIVMTIVGGSLLYWPISGFVMWRRRMKNGSVNDEF
ncbi:MAG: PepSY-associated TM helix domain-containing protein [Lysobacterales bacterium]